MYFVRSYKKTIKAPYELLLFLRVFSIMLTIVGFIINTKKKKYNKNVNNGVRYGMYRYNINTI